MLDQRRVLAGLPQTLYWRMVCRQEGVRAERVRTWRYVLRRCGGRNALESSKPDQNRHQHTSAGVTYL